MYDVPDRPLDPEFDYDITYCEKCGAEMEESRRDPQLCKDCRPKSVDWPKDNDLNETLVDITRSLSLGTYL